jgi:PAP2 superfamily
VQAVLADLVWRLRVESRVLKYTSTGQASLSFDFATPSDIWWLDQIDKVQRAAIEREDRLPEILAQSDDLWSFFRVVLGIDTGTSPILEELLAVAWKWATPLVMALKNDVAAQRPVHWAPRVLPAIATPAHGSLPSGHATMAALTAEILSQLMFGGDQTHPRVQQLDRLVRRIAFNRVVAGVHFPADSSAGYALGLQLASHFIAWATGQAPYKAFTFEPETDFELTEAATRPACKRQAKKDGRSKPLVLLWDAATREAHRSTQ